MLLWSELVVLIEPYCPTSGHRGEQPLQLKSMLRVHIVQIAYNYSDPDMEDALDEIASLIAAPPSTRSTEGKRDSEMYSSKQKRQPMTFWCQHCCVAKKRLSWVISATRACKSARRCRQKPPLQSKPSLLHHVLGKLKQLKAESNCKISCPLLALHRKVAGYAPKWNLCSGI
ncbi:hypothetical protein Neut_2383 [Nitrosomonas eutropha C91]|uniref:Transposase InsH N-terminal domain-containing protein n=1 Tax=Nitrosomonas eutropha (strain DSM 101675 / C91 / Nm57) TaxID=335283 RepID=Q0ADI5_NITEC|nr:hypothetical protein Neut_2383 [Nitrosomonas eutropha C91]